MGDKATFRGSALAKHAPRLQSRPWATPSQTKAPTSPVATGEGDHEVVEGALPPHDGGPRKWGRV